MTAPDAPDVVAVTGASGYVGRFVVAKLLAMGARVRALARPSSNRGGFPAPLEWVDGDLGCRDSLEALVHGAGSVVHLAYEHVPGRFRGGEGDDLDAWMGSNVTGSLHLASAAQRAGVARFVFLSSRAVFSHTEPGRMLTENHPVSPDSYYGAYKVAVEAFLHSFDCQTDMRTFAVRATGVYGVTWPIEKSKWWDIVVRSIADSEYSSEGEGTEVYGGDIADLVWALLNRPLIHNRVFHMSDLCVSHALVAQLSRRCTGMASSSPAKSLAGPVNPLECSNIRELGLRLGGMRRLEETIRQMVSAASENCKSSHSI